MQVYCRYGVLGLCVQATRIQCTLRNKAHCDSATHSDDCACPTPVLRSLRKVRSRSPSRGTPPGSSPASPYQQAPAGSADRESGDRPAKQIRTAVRTMDWNARRSVVHSCSLFPPPADSCIASALKKCSIASLCAPIFRPARTSSCQKPDTIWVVTNTHRLRPRYI